MKSEMKTKAMIAGAVFCAALFLFPGSIFCRRYLGQKQSTEAFEEVAEPVEEEPDLPVLGLESGPEPVQKETTASDKYANVCAQNNDLVGWVSIPGTRIDYPTMQTKDNPGFYLKHVFDKSYNSYGVPYVQGNCDIGISDNLVLYDHHMDNGSMFSNLCKYEGEDSYQGHKIIHFDTLESFGEYEVIVIFKTVAYPQKESKYYHFIRVESAKQFDECIAEYKELAFCDTGVTVECGDKLTTLSTCEYPRTNGRVVVLAKPLGE